MVPPDGTPERAKAVVKLRRAQEEMSRRKLSRAEQLLHEAIEADRSFVEPHMWLAKVYEQAQEPRKAARAYQSVLQLDRANAEAWSALEKLDPGAAERLRRLAEIGSDPFTLRGQARAEGGDLSDLAETEEGGGPVGVPDFGARRGLSEDLAGEISEVAPLAPGRAAGATDGSGQARGAAPWEYEQDRPMLERWLALPAAAHLATEVARLWEERGALDTVYADGVHLDTHVHATVWEALVAACERLELESPQAQAVTERGLDVIVIQDRPLSVAVLMGFMRGLDQSEQTFQFARALHPARAGYLAAWQAAEVIVGRRPTLAAGCEDTLREALGGRDRAWRRHLEQAETDRLRKTGHAWQQRVALSADRAGLLACRDLDVACRAIARGCARGPEEARSASVARLLEQFTGRDAAALAAIPPEDCPSRSEPYAAYRIQMLRWWAKTPEGRALLA